MACLLISAAEVNTSPQSLTRNAPYIFLGPARSAVLCLGHNRVKQPVFVCIYIRHHIRRLHDRWRSVDSVKGNRCERDTYVYSVTPCTVVYAPLNCTVSPVLLLHIILAVDLANRTSVFLFHVHFLLQ